jgi:hypothetical protein
MMRDFLTRRAIFTFVSGDHYEDCIPRQSTAELGGMWILLGIDVFEGTLELNVYLLSTSPRIGGFFSNFQIFHIQYTHVEFELEDLLSTIRGSTASLCMLVNIEGFNIANKTRSLAFL